MNPEIISYTMRIRWKYCLGVFMSDILGSAFIVIFGAIILAFLCDDKTNAILYITIGISVVLLLLSAEILLKRRLIIVSGNLYPAIPSNGFVRAKIPLKEITKIEVPARLCGNSKVRIFVGDCEEYCFKAALFNKNDIIEFVKLISAIVEFNKCKNSKDISTARNFHLIQYPVGILVYDNEGNIYRCHALKNSSSKIPFSYREIEMFLGGRIRIYAICSAGMYYNVKLPNLKPVTPFIKAISKMKVISNFKFVGGFFYEFQRYVDLEEMRTLRLKLFKSERKRLIQLVHNGMDEDILDGGIYQKKSILDAQSFKSLIGTFD